MLTVMLVIEKTHRLQKRNAYRSAENRIGRCSTHCNSNKVRPVLPCQESTERPASQSVVSVSDALSYRAGPAGHRGTCDAGRAGMLRQLRRQGSNGRKGVGGGVSESKCAFSLLLVFSGCSFNKPRASQPFL